VAFALIYQMVTMLLGWIVRHARSDTSKEIEIRVLRHQHAVLRRRAKRPKLSWTDRALIAALSRLLRTPRRLGLLATPAPSCDPVAVASVHWRNRLRAGRLRHHAQLGE
jgi:putative transposase